MNTAVVDTMATNECCTDAIWKLIARRRQQKTRDLARECNVSLNSFPRVLKERDTKQFSEANPQS